MNSNNPPPIDPKSQVRVLVNLAGRLMIASLEEFACKIIDMSPSAMHVYCVGFPNIGERIIAYIDHIGRDLAPLS
jgi:hypothetical protein